MNESLQNDKAIKWRNTLRYILRMFLSLVAQGIIFFSAAGELQIPTAWLFFYITFFYYLFSFIILYKVTPKLINQRGGSVFKEDTKSWDKFILLAYTILGVYGQFFVAGWDIGRIHWWPLGLEYLWIGLILYLISVILIVWAMIQNPFFEPTVRIQKDRDQRVITSGPYQIIRHPGYLSGILWHVALPLIIGSSLALIFAFIIIILLIVRTYLEDNTLQEELEGYTQYTKKVKYRLFPEIW
ncbi:MAG: isoprenylcysteine carboxylmethyltransferase family protein [Euryarchaeota archaeon]|nr:isoprenylcysteine carboxylmethyltransferase family protein [Euryarchaeota archaeon]